jgi:hypothetical protein
LLAANRRRRASGSAAAHPSLLAGLVADEKGRKLTATHTSKGPRRYRYYASPPGSEALRVPAAELEQLVLAALTKRLSSHEAVAADVLALEAAPQLTEALARAHDTAAALGKLQGPKLRSQILELVQAVVVRSSSVDVLLHAAVLVEGANATIAITTPASLARRGQNLALVLPATPQPKPDAALVACVAQAHTWFAELANGKVKSLKAIAERDGVTPSYVGKLLDLAFLAPDLVQMIMEGKHSPVLTASRLKSLCPLPADFSEQRALLTAA